jgi:N-acetylmuramoyl-L-alanine amidase
MRRLLRRLLPGLLLALAPAAAPAAEGRLLVVIDPGHGGEKDGAISAGGLKEKDVCLAVAWKLKDKLEQAGHRAVLTRAKDEGLALEERVALANQRGADLFVSIHANSMPEPLRARTHGIETYFLSAEATDDAALAVARAENADGGPRPEAKGGTVDAILADLARTEAHAESSRLAYALHGKLLAATGRKDRGVHQAPFAVLEGAAMPAALVEIGYLSHGREAGLLGAAAEQEAIASALALGIAEFGRDVLARRAGHPVVVHP